LTAAFVYPINTIMNIQELDAYNLDDAVKFNDHLNPKLWDSNEHLRDDVRAQLLLIAEDFRESLGISDLALKDITISGSNAAYTYTPSSDIDLHLVVDQPEDPVYRELFDAKKAQYNDTHDIKIRGFDVELYVEAADKPPVSQGTYSLLQDKWLQVPRRARATVDDTATRNKFETVGHAIERAVKTGSREKMDRMARKIKRMRQTGLEQHGEFGPENLAFKILRSQGVLKKLHDARIEAKNQELSLKERRRPHSVFTYGFRHESELTEVGLSPDGTNPTTCMVDDDIDTAPTDEQVLKDFIDFCSKELKLEHMPEIKLRKDPQWAVVHKTFGRYINDRNLLEVAWGQRHIMDVLRTVAHELTHKHQHERDGSRMGPDAGETGSPWENEANARAGILMRDYARLHPDFFAAGQAEHLDGNEVTESASGYIPTKKQAKDPRYVMALTKDVRPGAVGREANKLKLKTNSQGQPQQLKPNGLFEKLSLELAQFKRKGTIVESEELDEVRMAASNLQQFANSPEAEGIQCGFEAELIFRDTQRDEDSGEMEPDYDMDERCTSLSQIIEFFSNDEYGYGLSRRERNDLEEKLDEAYYEWHDEQMYDSWRDERDELIRDYFLEQQSWHDRLQAMLVDGMELTDEQAEAIIALGESRKNGEIKGSELSDEQLDMLDKYKEAAEGADEILTEEVESCLAAEDSNYDEVLQNFRDDFVMDDDSSFFSDQGWRWMSDIADTFNLSWPYFTGSDVYGGSRSWDEIGDSLHDAIDMPVKVSSGYHSATRKPGLWIVEPDSSLDPDDEEDCGLEIVSPPMPLKQALEKLEEVTDWANGDGNAYTNQSTGLHMGVSIPYKEGRVDYLKLILFLGDEYVLKQFGRESNTYTKAAMKDIRSRASSERNIASVMELLRNNLLELAERELVKSTGEGKYTSAHKQGKYIEFRSAGGDWLAEGDAEPGKLENTMMRYAYAMYLAGRPDLERKEYAKKLYKLINPQGDDALNLFTQFATGEIDKEQLKKQWAEKTLSKEVPEKKSNWKLYNNSTGQPVAGQEYNNFDYEEAHERAKKSVSPGSSVQDFDRAYTLRDVGEGSNQWRVLRGDNRETLEIIQADTRNQAVEQAYEKYGDVIPFFIEPYNAEPKEKVLSPRAKLAKNIVQRPKQTQQSPQSMAVDAKGVPEWEIVDRDSGNVIHRFSNLEGTAARTQAMQYLQSLGAEPGYEERFDVRRATVR